MTTQETIKKAVDYAKENNIKNIVVATTTGGNRTYLEDEKDLHIVGVTNAYDQGQNQMREEVRKHFEEAGMDIVTAGHALSGAERCFSTYFGGYGPTEIVANTLRMFSQGVKVCVEVSTMALDAISGKDRGNRRKWKRSRYGGIIDTILYEINLGYKST